MVSAVALTSGMYLFFIADTDDGSLDTEHFMKGAVEIDCGTADKSTAYGSGFIIERDGIKVISNAHVVTTTADGATKAYERVQESERPSLRLGIWP
ncbi:MAG: hypothetical protein LBU30_00570 [Candidatus Methanoplasma sp.]|jgi:S1-C subfamily serine protease|nr:hypothetical protein [Candidatus Methanoplasma sp.]